MDEPEELLLRAACFKTGLTKTGGPQFQTRIKKNVDTEVGFFSEVLVLPL